MRTETVKLLANNFAFLEGPRWYDGHLWASDITDMKLYRITAAGEREVVCDVPRRPSGIGFMPDGSPVIASMVDRKLMRIVDGELVLHADLSALAPADLNDLVVDDLYDLFGGAVKELVDLFCCRARWRGAHRRERL
ncbi:SMP-30/gluconolactonase/LRE family protein [Paraburkholderia franconis]|nr:SMP-30/gluconolactonase/LRE family protein [Paraburkholderia franconis]